MPQKRVLKPHGLTRRGFAEATWSSYNRQSIGGPVLFVQSRSFHRTSIEAQNKQQATNSKQTHVFLQTIRRQKCASKSTHIHAHVVRMTHQFKRSYVRTYCRFTYSHTCVHTNIDTTVPPLLRRHLFTSTRKKCSARAAVACFVHTTATPSSRFSANPRGGATRPRRASLVF